MCARAHTQTCLHIAPTHAHNHAYTFAHLLMCITLSVHKILKQMFFSYRMQPAIRIIDHFLSFCNEGTAFLGRYAVWGRKAGLIVHLAWYALPMTQKCMAVQSLPIRFEKISLLKGRVKDLLGLNNLFMCSQSFLWTQSLDGLVMLAPYVLEGYAYVVIYLNVEMESQKHEGF